ncbi:hypothetical protein LT493_23175 [Streptomyces tricolor]|nr:hypothetical protein [Streptomyces tricolor]
MSEAMLAGDTGRFVHGGRHVLANLADEALPTPLGTLLAPARAHGADAHRLHTVARRGATTHRPRPPTRPRRVRNTMAGSGHGRVMSPGTVGPSNVSALLAELSGNGAATGAEGRAPLPSGWSPPSSTSPSPSAPGDMEGVPAGAAADAAAAADGELDSRHARQVAPDRRARVLLGAALYTAAASRTRTWPGRCSRPCGGTTTR